MARDFQINGETMVYVKGPGSSSISARSELGLSDGPISVTFGIPTEDLIVDAWGHDPVDVQTFGLFANISMSLIHYDPTVLDECLRLSSNGAFDGQGGRAGTRIGKGLARFANGNNFIGLNLASPQQGKPFRFFFTHLIGPPVTLPLGTQKSVVQLNWRAIRYTTDPWNGGNGAQASQLFDHTLD